MTPTQLWLVGAIIVALAPLAVFAFWRMHMPWPAGPRMSRTAALGNKVVVIDAPGTDGERLLLLDACATATTALFTAWHAWRLKSAVGSEPAFTNALDATVVVEAFALIGVHFIDDSLMDDVQHALFNGEKIPAYLSGAAPAFRAAPLAVIRKSLAAEMVATGQPLMHEMLHALLNQYLPDAPGQRDHTHIAFDLVQGAACRTFLELYAPKRP